MKESSGSGQKAAMKEEVAYRNNEAVRMRGSKKERS